MKSDPDAAVFFFDEGRFGLQPSLGRMWARKGKRPVAEVKTGYENFYVYSAICPATGEDATLFLPWVNTDMMNIFVEHLAARLDGRRCFLIMDQAGWHSSEGLAMPPNIEPIFLPPRSPELNPVERFWDWLKRNTIRNRFFQTIEEIMDAVEDYMKFATPDVLKSLCGCNYLSH